MKIISTPRKNTPSHKNFFNTPTIILRLAGHKDHLSTSKENQSALHWAIYHTVYACFQQQPIPHIFIIGGIIRSVRLSHAILRRSSYKTRNIEEVYSDLVSPWRSLCTFESMGSKTPSPSRAKKEIGHWEKWSVWLVLGLSRFLHGREVSLALWYPLNPAQQVATFITSKIWTTSYSPAEYSVRIW